MIDSMQEQTNNGVIEKYCYSDDPANCTAYGGLYEWAEAVQYQNGATDTSSPNPALSGNVQGICPGGWHIPTYNELDTLAAAVNHDGNALLAIGQGMAQYEGAGTNTIGFSALLGGGRNIDGFFTSLGNGAYFWSSTEGDSDGAYGLPLGGSGGYVYLSYYGKMSGSSVRCMKD
jgi:uncharacterized protein (TIGR02145 family)